MLAAKQSVMQTDLGTDAGVGSDFNKQSNQKYRIVRQRTQSDKQDRADLQRQNPVTGKVQVIRQTV